MTDSISKKIYEHKVRARACGIMIQNDAILMLRHKSVGPSGYIWSPPGGGVAFDEDAKDTVVKEFLEETGLHVKVDDFLFVNEYRDNRHHAIELFFSVSRLGGQLKLGLDPEVPASEQILDKIDWVPFDRIKTMNANNLHNIFRELEHPADIVELRGFFNFTHISIK